MVLVKYKLGGLIEQIDARNSNGYYSVDDVCGISTGKEFIETKANMDGVSLTSYKIVCKNEFAYVADTSRRGDKIALAFNTEKEKLISSIYTVFRVSRPDLLSSDYLFMYFNRPEFDRYARFNSWGSARETFNWEDMCDIDIELPPLSIQQKYVDVYKAMLVNQQSYERGLEDLKLTCDAFVENAGNCRYEKLGRYIARNLKKNDNERFSKADVKGFNNYGQFIKPMRLFSGEVSTFKIIAKGDFVYNSRVNSTIERLSIAYNEGEDLIVTPAYETFYVSDETVLYPYYLYFLLQRDSFAKKVLFISFGSATTFLSFDVLSDVEIPIIDYESQKAIADVYRVYKERYEINEQLKAKIKNLCSILIKGSIEEARKEA